MAKPTCIIIGAGLAGLSAANYLAKRGWSLTVLESAERVGGRVFSTGFEQSKHENLVCELGGEWIGDGHTRMKRLCREFGLWPLKPHRFSSMFWPSDGLPTGRRFRPGQWPFSEKAARGFRKLRRQYWQHKDNKLKMRALDQSDWWTLLGRNGFTGDELLQRDLMDSTDFGESIRLTSAYLAATEYFGDSATNEMDFKIEGGNDRLPRAIAKHIEKHHDVRLGAVVRAVKQSEHGVHVFIKGRKTPFTAECCICTAPAHRLLSIHWKPALDRLHLNAARQLQYSRIMKTAVLYANRFWEKAKPAKEAGFSVFTSRASDFCFDSTFGQPGKMGILCSYSIGDKADDLAAENNPNNLMKWITEDVVCAVQPKRDVVVAPIDVRPQPWQKETAIGGAYAFYRPGQWFAVREALARPHRKRVFFAGEHLSEEAQGFMEGAVETGEASARLVASMGRAMSRSGRGMGRTGKRP